MSCFAMSFLPKKLGDQVIGLASYSTENSFVPVRGLDRVKNIIVVLAKAFGRIVERRLRPSE